jgi:hypothetical protein
MGRGQPVGPLAASSDGGISQPIHQPRIRAALRKAASLSRADALQRLNRWPAHPWLGSQTGAL